MPGQISWLVKNRVVVLKYMGNVVIEELEKIAEVGNPLIESSDVPLVHVIIDETEMTDHPRNVIQTIKVMNSTLSHPKLGWLIFIAIPNEIIALVTKMALGAARTRHQVVNTYEEASRTLMDVDSTLQAFAPLDIQHGSILLYEINGSDLISHAIPD
ncbi:MAG: hypothetical protein KC615_20795 [Anaerolineae bacterium]|nr:hypothetical protein [Anaerolineae bacterium]